MEHFIKVKTTFAHPEALETLNVQLSVEHHDIFFS